MYEVDVEVYRSGKSSVAHGKKMTITPYIDRWVIILDIGWDYTVHLRQETFCSNGGYET